MYSPDLNNEYRYFITEVMDPEFLRKASDLFYENYYYYVEYSKDINIEKIVNNLSSLTGGTYE